MFDFVATLLHVQIEMLIVQVAPFRISTSTQVLLLLISLFGIVSFDVIPTGPKDAYLARIAAMNAGVPREVS